jgi:intein/homing endonuclease
MNPYTIVLSGGTCQGLEYGLWFMQRTTEQAKKKGYLAILTDGQPQSIIDAIKTTATPIYYGCVSQDTIIPLPNGNIIQVKDLNSPMSVFSAHVKGCLKEASTKKKARLDIDTCTHLIFKGYREVWKVKTPFMEIEATPDHEFFVRSSDPKDGPRASWKPLNQIKVRDRILAVTKLPFMETINPPLSEQQVQCLGFYTGDGTLYEEEEHGAWQVRLTDPQAKEEYSELYKEAFHVRPIDKGQRGFLICNKKLTKLIEGLGLNVKSPFRDIPEIICRSPLRHQLAFINGLLDSDADIVPEQHLIRFYSTSRPLLAKLQMILLRFGILSTIYRRNRIGEPVRIQGKIKGYSKYPETILVLCGAEAFKLAQMLKPLNKNKKEALKRLINDYPKHRQQGPEGVAKVNEHLAFLRVKRIEKVGIKPVYDLVVNNNHNFIANGIIVHNCGHGACCAYTVECTQLFLEAGPYTCPPVDTEVYRCVTNMNLDLMRGRHVHLLSCLTGQYLGKELVYKHGARSFIGYQDLFVYGVCLPAPDNPNVCLYYPQPGQLPNEYADFYTFMDSDAAGEEAILNMGTVQDAVNAIIDKIKSYIYKYTYGEWKDWSYAPEAALVHMHNLKALVAYGDMNWRPILLTSATPTASEVAAAFLTPFSLTFGLLMAALPAPPPVPSEVKP